MFIYEAPDLSVKVFDTYVIKQHKFSEVTVELHWAMVYEAHFLNKNGAATTFRSSLFPEL